jgi:hypothetical protein
MLHIVKYCAEECERQQSGEMSVYNMLVGYMYVRDFFPPLFSNKSRNAEDWMKPNQVSEARISMLGQFIEPNKNSRGFRYVPVTIGYRICDQDHATIVHQMHNLCESGWNLTPEEWYHEFEVIHPFVDGNGRVGSILYNYLSDRMGSPVAPPTYESGLDLRY